MVLLDTVFDFPFPECHVRSSSDSAAFFLDPRSELFKRVCPAKGALSNSEKPDTIYEEQGADLKLASIGGTATRSGR